MASLFHKLVSDYKSTQSSANEYELAIAEAKIYDQGVIEGIRQEKEIRSKFLFRFLGVNAHTLNYRAALLNTQQPKLWECVLTEHMTVRTALDLHRRVKLTAITDGRPYNEVLQELLTEYRQKLPVKLPNGKITRKKKPKGRFAKMETPKVPRDVWGMIRQLISQTLTESMRDCDPTFLESTQRELMLDLQALSSVYQGKIKRIIATTSGARINVGDLTLSSVNNSLLTLNHDPIKRLGNHVDTMKLKKSFRYLVKKFHPDQNGGNEVLRANFEAVQKAYEVVEDYLTLYP